MESGNNFFSDSGSKIVEKMREVDMLVVIMMFAAVGDGGSGYPQMRTHLQPHLHSGYASLMAQHTFFHIVVLCDRYYCWCC